MPRRIYSPRMRKKFSAPADATAAKGTRRPSIMRAFEERRFRRGHDSVQAKCNRARGRDGNEIVLCYNRGWESGGFVGIGVVDDNIERLIYNLPGESPECLAMLAIVGMPE
jgi:hypothetical protein